MDRYDILRKMEQQPDAKLKDLVMQLLYQEIISLKESEDDNNGSKHTI